jgi:hypothetical protein
MTDKLKTFHVAWSKGQPIRLAGILPFLIEDARVHFKKERVTETEAPVEIGQITISGIPSEATLDRGEKTPDGTWILSRDDFIHMKMKIGGATESFWMTVTAAITSPGQVITPTHEVEARLLRAQFHPIVPEGDGYMSVAAVLHWIARKGLVNDPPSADFCYRAEYKKAAREFAERCVAGKISVIGWDSSDQPHTMAPDQFGQLDWIFYFGEDRDLFSAVVCDKAKIVVTPCDDDQQSYDEFWAAGATQPTLKNLRVHKESIRTTEWHFEQRRVEGHKETSTIPARAPPPPRLTKKSATSLVREYVEREKAEGRTPTQKGLEQIGREYRGGRGLLRAAFAEICGSNPRGRPKNNSLK